MVELDSLENCCGASQSPWVRIPLSPFFDIFDFRQDAVGGFCKPDNLGQ